MSVRTSRISTILGEEVSKFGQTGKNVYLCRAEESIASTGIPIYKTGTVSRLLLYGDMVRLGIVVSPTVEDMATLIMKADSGAMRGLEILGWKREMTSVEALEMLHGTLNTHLSRTTKAALRLGFLISSTYYAKWQGSKEICERNHQRGRTQRQVRGKNFTKWTLTIL